jgi:putative protease
MEVVNDEDGEHLLSSRDLCTINRLHELLPHIDAMKIEGRSKSEFYVSAITKAYKHMRDALVKGTPLDEKIVNLVYMVPHRMYWEGFLFNPLKAFPDGENEKDTQNENKVTQTTGTTAGPLFNRNYFGTFTPETIQQHGKVYHHLNPKEEITRGMRLHYLSPETMGELEIEDIVDAKGKSLEKADCNMTDVFIQTSLPLQGRENLYQVPLSTE